MDEGRRLLAAASPGPWERLTHGTASQRDAAGRLYEATMATRAEDNPEIEYTDLTWIDLADGRHVGATGNGPNAPANAALIVWLRNNAEALLEAARLADPPDREGEVAGTAAAIARHTDFNDGRFLAWLRDRLEFVYHESPNLDWMHRLARLASERADPPALDSLDAAVLAWVIHGLGFENFQTVYRDDVTEPTAEQERVAARIALEYQRRRAFLSGERADPVLDVPLDVERLARAIEAFDLPLRSNFTLTDTRYIADTVAAEYARLTGESR